MNNLTEQAAPLHQPDSTPFSILNNFGPPDLVERFIKKINIAENGCWIWTGQNDATKPVPYGRFCYRGWNKGATRPRCHRVSFYWSYGEKPELLDHFHCDNPSCCNPFHVRPSTQWENIQRTNSASAMNARKTHCPRGHPLEYPNLKNLSKPNGRSCLTCHTNYTRKDYWRKKKSLAPVNSY